LQGSILRGTDLTDAKLKGSDLSSATIFSANLTRTDLRQASGLESLQSVSYAKFNDTRVTRKEEQILRMILDHGKLFDIRDCF
jgi:uncharacterized protein YjbI with pentapeptide repeats